MLALATAIGSAGLAAGGTAGALLGAELTGTEAAAGLPLGLLVVGQAATAVLVSRRTVRVGRGRGLSEGYVLGALGRPRQKPCNARAEPGLAELGRGLFVLKY